MAEAAQAQIDFAQTVEEQQPGPDYGMLELALDELQRRERARLEQQSALSRSFQRLFPALRLNGRASRFGAQDPFQDGNESVAPALERRGVASAELGEGFRGAVEIGPPAERVAALEQQRDVQLRLDIARAAALELELAVPRQLVERAVEERVDVVAVAGPARVFERREAAADGVAALEAQRLEPGAPEVSLEDEAVVPRPQEDAVVRLQSPLMGAILIDLSRKALV